MRLSRLIFCLSLLAMPAFAAAQSEPRTIEIPAGNSWRHAETRITLPPNLAGLARRQILDNSDAETDIVAYYASDEQGIFGAVYVYRTMTPDVPIWFDRALDVILLDQQGATRPAITAFARPGASAASGLRAATTDSVPGMRSAAIAVVPLGSWLVKIRLSAPRLDPAALEERLSAVVAALSWPAETGTARAAVPIEPCPTPLRLRNARVLPADGADVLMDSVIRTVEPEGEPGPPPVYCREPGATMDWGVYRPDGSTDSYLIALHDAGIAVAVGDASGLSALLGQSGRRRFSVTLLEGNGSSVYSSFDRLPPPEQVLALVRGGQPLSTTTTGGGERR